MCNKRNSTKAYLSKRDIYLKLDKCMARFIEHLNMNGIKTVGCCCGHGKYPMTIIVEDDHKFYDLVSGVLIPRKKRYYLKDKQGYYYIPETVTNSTQANASHLAYNKGYEVNQK